MWLPSNAPAPTGLAVHAASATWTSVAAHGPPARRVRSASIRPAPITACAPPATGEMLCSTDAKVNSA